MVTCEIKKFYKSFAKILVFYFTYNHAWNRNNKVLAAVSQFLQTFSDLVTCDIKIASFVIILYGMHVWNRNNVLGAQVLQLLLNLLDRCDIWN